MTEPSFEDLYVANQTRVLLCISNPRNRTLLSERIADDTITVVVPEDIDSLPKFDVCVVDTTMYPSVSDQLERRRAELAPVHLPILLVLGPNDSEAAARQVSSEINDILPVPTSGPVLKRRVEALIHTRKQSEQLALFRRAIDDATAGITIADAGGDQELRYVNDAFVEMTGYDRESVLGRNCRFLQGPGTDPEPVSDIRAAIEAVEPVTAELRNYRDDGTMFWNHVEIAPVYGEHGVTHFVGFQQDITERVEQNSSLERYERIVQAAGDPIYALDSALNLTLLNDATAELCSGTKSSLVGERLTAVFGNEHAETIAKAIQELTESAPAETTVETTVTDNENRPRRYQTAVALLPATEFAGVVCVSRDITEDRQRESRLSVLDRVLRHNLRNKLMVMMARVEFIQDQSPDEGIRESATAIETAAEELLDIAETARSFEETIDPDTDGAVGPVDIYKHTTHAVEESILEYGTVEFVPEIADTAWARAHDSFELAMTELLGQAAEATDCTTVTVDVREDRSTDQVRITVSHDGEPLDEVKRRALTDGFESELQHTSGLGLWFVRWMTVNSGGTFTIADSGTTVELTLPIADLPPSGRS